jgi:RNA polymerase sigma-70 factor (ECF subfamily)
MTEPTSIPTRQSLLARLKDWEDHASWRQFFDLYWRLIHATALKAGLSENEAQEVVQEVMITAAKKMPDFTYVPGKDSLKGWLLAVTRWKVGDQFRKRQQGIERCPQPPVAPSGRPGMLNPDDDMTSTETGEHLVDPRADLEAIWDSEWRENLLQAALDRLKPAVNPAHYEMYHLHVVQGLSVKETARALGVNQAAVHLAKHRIGQRLRAEIKRLKAISSNLPH